MRELDPYFEDVIRILGDGVGADEIADLAIDTRAYQFGRLVCTLHYPDGSRLDILLWAVCADDAIEWTHYRVHYRDVRDQTRFRYDNAPHHPDLPNFPHHLHLPDGATVGVLRPGLRLIAALISTHLAGTNPFADDLWRTRYLLLS
ncbi:MAG: toxin-antitoxin system TumE family protein [Dehalococcoidia bacterium]